MKHWLQKILRAYRAAPRGAVRQRYRMTIEHLEDRLALSRSAVIDFDGPTVSAQRFTDGQWQNQAQVNFASFRGMFVAGADDVLDQDGSGTVNATDADLAISRILARVRQDYAPYDLSVRTGSLADNAARLTDDQVGDVLVVASGGSDFRAGQTAFGVSPWSDMGNEHDEVIFAFGGAIAGAAATPAEFINRMARTISHEMGHSFGLGHVIVDADLTNADMLDAQTHHLMSGGGIARDFTHDFNFQDLKFKTDVRQFRFSESVLHPELNDDSQNSHRYLSNAAVLGTSSGPWLAMLKPGELTIHGSVGGDTLTLIESGNAGATLLTFVQISMIPTIPTQPPIPVVMSGTLNATATAGGSFTLNPYAKAMTKVIAATGDGNDTITGAGLTTIRLFANGGAGQDTITGGRADDELRGGSGNDTLRGGQGNDRLFGDTGLDQLFGDEGADRLDGGADGARDVLFGHNLTTPDDNAVDTFVRHIRLSGFAITTEIDDERDRKTNDSEEWTAEFGEIQLPF